MVKGRSDASVFEPEVIADPEIKLLAERVTLEADQEMTASRNDYPSALVSIGLKDGRTITHSNGSHFGDYLNRRPHNELVEKFRRLSESAITESRSENILESVRSLEKLPSVRVLTKLLAD